MRDRRLPSPLISNALRPVGRFGLTAPRIERGLLFCAVLVASSFVARAQIDLSVEDNAVSPTATVPAPAGTTPDAGVTAGPMGSSTPATESTSTVEPSPTAEVSPIAEASPTTEPTATAAPTATPSPTVASTEAAATPTPQPNGPRPFGRTCFLLLGGISWDEWSQIGAPNNTSLPHLRRLMNEGALGMIHLPANVPTTSARTAALATAANRSGISPVILRMAAALSSGVDAPAAPPWTGALTFAIEEQADRFALPPELAIEQTPTAVTYARRIGWPPPARALLNLGWGALEQDSLSDVPTRKGARRVRDTVSRSDRASHYGVLGGLAHAASGRTVAIGSADTGLMPELTTPRREWAMIGTDSHGVVDGGDITERLLEADRNSPFGVRANMTATVSALEKELKNPATAIIALEWGDTRRAALYAPWCAPAIAMAHRRQALKRADAFVGALLSRLLDPRDRIVLLAVPDLQGGEEQWLPLAYWQPMRSHAGAMLSGDLNPDAPGVVTLPELTATMARRLNPGAPPTGFSSFFKNTIRETGGGQPIPQRLAQLLSLQAGLVWLQQMRPLAHALLALLFAFTFVVSLAPLVRGGAPTRPRRRESGNSTDAATSGSSRSERGRDVAPPFNAVPLVEGVDLPAYAHRTSHRETTGYRETLSRSLSPEELGTPTRVTPTVTPDEDAEKAAGVVPDDGDEKARAVLPWASMFWIWTMLAPLIGWLSGLCVQATWRLGLTSGGVASIPGFLKVVLTLLLVAATGLTVLGVGRGWFTRGGLNRVGLGVLWVVLTLVGLWLGGFVLKWNWPLHGLGTFDTWNVEAPRLGDLWALLLISATLPAIAGLTQPRIDNVEETRRVINLRPALLWMGLVLWIVWATGNTACCWVALVGFIALWLRLWQELASRAHRVQSRRIVLAVLLLLLALQSGGVPLEAQIGGWWPAWSAAWMMPWWNLALAVLVLGSLTLIGGARPALRRYLRPRYSSRAMLTATAITATFALLAFGPPGAVLVAFYPAGALLFDVLAENRRAALPEAA